MSTASEWLPQVDHLAMNRDSREWPDSGAHFPWNYAACFKLCQEAIHALPGHAQDEVLIIGSGAVE